MKTELIINMFLNHLTFVPTEIARISKMSYLLFLQDGSWNAHTFKLVLSDGTASQISQLRSESFRSAHI